LTASAPILQSEIERIMRAVRKVNKCEAVAVELVIRTRCAKIAKVAWMNCPFGSIADADTMNDLCEYIAEQIKTEPVQS